MIKAQKIENYKLERLKQLKKKAKMVTEKEIMNKKKHDDEMKRYLEKEKEKQEMLKDKIALDEKKNSIVLSVTLI